MSKKNKNMDFVPPVEESENVTAKQSKKKKKKGSGAFGRFVRRFFLMLFTIIILAFVALCLVLNLFFNGPSPAARNVLTMALTEASATKWVPGVFMDAELVESIRTGDTSITMEESVTDISKVVIQTGSSLSATNEWEKYPDGIRFEDYAGDTYNAHIMIVRDPAQVGMGLSTTEGFSTARPGKRITEFMNENANVIAAVNAGAFNDDGTASSVVGSCPLGLVMSDGKCVWTSGKQPGLEGFAGFNKDNILVVSATNLSQSQAETMGIRDGCCFGPALIINGEVNMAAYNNNSGFNPRTCIGQRADGAVIFICVDGRQPSSLGATYADLIDIMQEYGAVNACNMDGGSSSVMMYRDANGIYGEAGQVIMMNNYSLLQSEPRRMPNYWVVRSAQ